MKKIAKELGLVFLLAAVAAGAGLVIDHLRDRPMPQPKETGMPQSDLPEARPSANRLTLAEFRAYAEGRRGVVLDARPEAAYRAGHVPGALCMPLQDFDNAYGRLKPQLDADKAQPIAVYCSGVFCKAAGIVEKKLIALGYTHVAVFTQGWPAWREAALPVEKTE